MGPAAGRLRGDGQRGLSGPYESGPADPRSGRGGQVPDVKVFHAGTARTDDRIVTDGGRVLGVTALGSTIAAAKLRPTRRSSSIRWEGAWCRKDISDKARTFRPPTAA